MSRPLRLEFSGATYHVTSRGDRREPIYIDDVDRNVHLEVRAQAIERFEASVLAYCLMGNHYHLVLRTRNPNLSRLMRHLNGVYTQRFNRRHRLVGHLFQGRFKAILVDSDAYLVALCRYVERNPVAAGLVEAASHWPWSSCRAHLGLEPAPEWLDTLTLHGNMLRRKIETPGDLRAAQSLYARMADAAGDPYLWSLGLRQQVFLGDEAFVDRMLASLPVPGRYSAEVPRAQRIRGGSLVDYELDGSTRDRALYMAYTVGGCTMTQLAKDASLSVSRVSRIIKAIEASRVTT